MQSFLNKTNKVLNTNGHTLSYRGKNRNICNVVLQPTWFAFTAAYFQIFLVIFSGCVTFSI